MNLKIIITSIFLFSLAASFAQSNEIDSLLQAFKRKDFDEAVWTSSLKLEKKEKEIIPALIQLLESSEYAKLYYSYQLMYPGTKRVIFDYEKIIPFELDWISIRAGWLLEEITFMDFGYSSKAICSPSILDIKINNRIETNEKIYTVNWQNRQTEEEIMQSRNILAAKVRKWWEQKKESWNRVSAIKDALQSNNEYRILKALDFVSFYDFRKESIDNYHQLYKSEIWPQIVLLKHSLIKSIPERLVEFFSERNSSND